MNDFEWRRQLRELRQPRAPRRDLWADIERALEHPVPASGPHARIAASSRTAWLFAVGLAAVTVLAVGLTRLPPATAPVWADLAAVPAWKPDDPRLAGAAIELTAAQYELRQALQQSPDSAALQRLLERTEQQESRLRQLGRDAG
ncbi:hypothetical protein ACO2Q2_03985 [Dyella sp. KRB-257]|uniref:hypothetical protein n=1 Tax=Dyella sp. KRB-257 TaxID=3400915 RepID=UPI003BFF081C